MGKWCVRRGVIVAAAFLLLSSCGESGGSSGSIRSPDDRPLVVVTHSILASVVEQIVGDDVQVRTLVPDGSDPHEHAPTAREIEMLSGANLIVRNGGGFDQSFDRVITDAQSNGVAVFTALDHVSHPPVGVVDDPHFFTDPESMSQVIEPLAKELTSTTRVDVANGSASLIAALDQASALMSADRARLDTGKNGANECVLVTGHESLRYLAARYDCTILGAVIPGQTSSAAATAADVARLKQLALGSKIGAIFVESTLSSRVAEQLAKELGVEVVTLDVEMLGEAATYQEYATSLMSTIVEGLLGS